MSAVFVDFSREQEAAMENARQAGIVNTHTQVF